MEWTKWTPPYDPRLVNGSTAINSENNRIIEIADCGIRCPGCGICCEGYRGGYTEDGSSISCNDACPGFGKCCPPFDLRVRPENTDDARKILLTRNDPQRWEIQESLMILAHEGTDEAIDILKKAMPKLPDCLKEFSECALDECRYFKTVPRNEAEAVLMMKKKVLEQWENRALSAQAKTEEEIMPELECRKYEYEIVKRLAAKAADDKKRDIFRIQTDVAQMMVMQSEDELEKENEDIELCNAIIAEIQSDINRDISG